MCPENKVRPSDVDECNYAQHRWGKKNTDGSGHTYDDVGFTVLYLFNAI